MKKSQRMNYKNLLLKPDLQKIPECVLLVANQKEHLYISEIMKVMFIADVFHLNKYGRPVTFSNYKAEYAGPVAVDVREMILVDTYYKIHMGTSRPWDLAVDYKGTYIHKTRRSYDDFVLSQTDIQTLNRSLDQVIRITNGDIRDYTTDHIAYRKAFKKRNRHMRWDLMLDTPQEEVLENLAYVR